MKKIIFTSLFLCLILLTSCNYTPSVNDKTIPVESEFSIIETIIVEKEIIETVIEYQTAIIEKECEHEWVYCGQLFCVTNNTENFSDAFICSQCNLIKTDNNKIICCHSFTKEKILYGSQDNLYYQYKITFCEYCKKVSFCEKIYEIEATSPKLYTNEYGEQFISLSTGDSIINLRIGARGAYIDKHTQLRWGVCDGHFGDMIFIIHNKKESQTYKDGNYEIFIWGTQVGHGFLSGKIKEVLKNGSTLYIIMSEDSVFIPYPSC